MTALLAARWPTARITGYDNSPEMLDKAHVEHEGPPRAAAVSTSPTPTPVRGRRASPAT
ncbi:putative Trans-aconitate 2-methyltransferase [Streptomyces afghaniensis 772]|uniref:Putative Trans-aconitate 2-methyltransferase n=1 Tax=Streptomyces afghaniensis 772 TaxID=1283301 RepID=S4MTP0_9ACTN|nr:putative Trans-aconitate 2-methyltransferase [Streptomyces afghaniensis 772]